jgi:hypothetical protein
VKEGENEPPTVSPSRSRGPLIIAVAVALSVMLVVGSILWANQQANMHDDRCSQLPWEAHKAFLSSDVGMLSDVQAEWDTLACPGTMLTI